jgi:hypothetical protein
MGAGDIKKVGKTIQQIAKRLRNPVVKTFGDAGGVSAKIMK